jgi:hypothetical protein
MGFVAVVFALGALVGGWWLVAKWLRTGLARHVLGFTVGVTAACSTLAGAAGFGWMGESSYRPPSGPIPSAELAKLNEPPARREPAPFTVLEDDVTRAGAKRTVRVELRERLAEAELRTITERLKATGPSGIEKTYVFYYVADATLSTAWATAHSRPDLEVVILGFTPEEFKRIQGLSVGMPNRVGSWIDEDQKVLVSVYKSSKNLVLRRDAADGSHDETALKLTRVGNQFRLDAVPQSSHGEFYTISGTGDLLYIGKQGVFRTLSPRGSVDLAALR